MAKAETLNDVVERAVEYLRRRVRVEGAYLFGSQLTGHTHADSDIDIAVFSPNAEAMSFLERVDLAIDLAHDCDSRLELHLFSSRALANARPTNFAGYILTYGKRLV